MGYHSNNYPASTGTYWLVKSFKTRVFHEYFQCKKKRSIIFFDISDNDYFEVLPCSNESHSLINTNPPRPVVEPIQIDKPSLENLSRLPLRYGSAFDIPYDDGFDLKSILSSKPILPLNDVMSLLRDDKIQKQPPSINNNFKELLLDHARDRENLVKIARQNQQDFMNAINLD
jgi:hypothetical protein